MSTSWYREIFHHVGGGDFLFFFLAHSQLALSGFSFGDVGHFPAWPIKPLDSTLLPQTQGR